MATKKTEKQEEKDLEILSATFEPEKKPEPEQVEEQEQTGGDEWDETIEMIVPRKPKGEDQQYYICVNDRRYLVPANGKMQKLPKPVALVLQDSLEMESEADDYADKLPKRDAINTGTII